jgi:hypothetical protein
VKAAIVDSLNVISSVVQWIAGLDDILGSSSFQIGHDDLLTQKSMTFSQRWKDGVSVGGAKDLIVDGPGRFVTSGGEWELHGHIEATEIIEFIPLPTDAPVLSPVTGAPDETWNGTWHGTLPGTDTPAIVVTIEYGSPGAHSVSVRESLSFHPPVNTQASAVATSLAMFTSYTHDIWTFPRERASPPRSANQCARRGPGYPRPRP